MDALPQSIRVLIDELTRLPGIGPKSAERLAFTMLKRPEAHNNQLGESILNVRTGVLTCERCFTLCSVNPCPICTDPNRDDHQICVVENILDLIALEKTRVYKGRYHVLQGKISPLDGIGPDDIRLGELFQRLTEPGSAVTELILALNPDLEGDTTALFIQKKLESFHPIAVTRLARGLSSGSSVEHADDATLVRALQGRQKL